MHQSAPQIKQQPISRVTLEKKNKCETVNSPDGLPFRCFMQEKFRIKCHTTYKPLPAAIANINFIITSGLYFITTLSLDEIIAI